MTIAQILKQSADKEVSDLLIKIIKSKSQTNLCINKLFYVETLHINCEHLFITKKLNEKSYNKKYK